MLITTSKMSVIFSCYPILFFFRENYTALRLFMYDTFFHLHACTSDMIKFYENIILLATQSLSIRTLW